MARKKREMAEFSMSFLDVICCGFGAVILLLMITKTVQPQIIEASTVNLEGLVADLQEQLFEIRGETRILNRDLNAKQEQLSQYQERIAILRGQLAGLVRLLDHVQGVNFCEFLGFEITPEWAEKLEPLHDSYPHRITIAQPGHFGMAVFSKFPFIDTSIVSFSHKGARSIVAEIELAQRETQIIVTHPPPPTNWFAFSRRNSHKKKKTTFTRFCKRLSGSGKMFS